MPLWGATDADESKPKFLTTAEKTETFATASGWVTEAGSARSGNGNVNADPEVLVAIRGLSTDLNLSDITEIEFVTTSFDVSDGGNIDVLVRFNEQVEVNSTGGTPYVTVTNDQNGGGSDASFQASYLSGTGTNELTFRKTYGAADGGIAATDELSIGANAANLNSGTINELSLDHFALEDGTTDDASFDEFIRLEDASADFLNLEGNTASTITNSSAIGAAAGTITAVA